MKLQRIIKCHDEAGSLYEVEEWQEFIDAGHMRDPDAVIPGMKELRLADGGRVNVVDQDTFQIVASGKILRRA